MNDLDWLQDAVDGLREEIAHECELAPGRPDLADVLARAHAIDADAVPEGLVALDAADEEEAFDPELELFADALRGEVEQDVHERAMHPASPPAPNKRRKAALVVVTAVAAAVVAAVGMGSLRPDAAQLDGPTPGSMVSKTVEELAKDEAFESVTPVSEDEHVITRSKTQLEPTPEPAVVPEPEEPSVEEVPEAPEAPKHSTRPRPSLEDLEREAMKAWKAGELARAEALLRKVIARAGRGAKAELAYGDLFALAKQRGGTSKQASVWRQYLRKFPKGRHADDARAGLCMRVSGEAASKCWSEYLERHPRGAHASRARRALE